jgi:drug/metabolite transporter (DMT)-like permease
LEPSIVDQSERPRHTDRERLVAAAQALFVTFLWATSWILIRIGLTDLDLRPLSFAGLRYALAAVLLAPVGWRALRRARAAGHGRLDRSLFGRLALLGLFFYAVAQGAQFAALAVLPAAAVGLVLSSIPLWVAAGAWLRGAEAATRGQLLGIGLLLVGAVLYFGPFALGPLGWLGLLAAAICALASTFGQHLSRDLNRDQSPRLGGPAGLTAVSMAIGAGLLLAVGVVLEGWPVLDLRGWAIVGWLAAVNTAFAFTLYNHTLRVLTAVESSVIVNTLLIMVAVMAWVLLGESLDARQVVGLLLASSGAMVVQVVPRLRQRRAERLGRG